MDQEFQIGNLKLIQDEQGYGVSQKVSKGTWQVIATFLYPLDALRYFTEFCMTLEQSRQENEIDKKDDKV